MDISLFLSNSVVFFLGMTSMTVGLDGLQTAASLFLPLPLLPTVT